MRAPKLEDIVKLQKLTKTRSLINSSNLLKSELALESRKRNILRLKKPGRTSISAQFGKADSLYYEWRQQEIKRETHAIASLSADHSLLKKLVQISTGQDEIVKHLREKAVQAQATRRARTYETDTHSHFLPNDISDQDI